MLNQETGSEEILQLIDNAAISSLNLSEIIAKLADPGIPEEEIRQILLHLNLEVVLFHEEQALRAGMMPPATKSIGLSFGDCACLALGIFLNQPVITTDRLWSNLNLGVEIRVVPYS